MQIIHSNRVKVVMGLMLISLGFIGISVYMMSTIFYPLSEFNNIFGNTLRNGVEKETDLKETLVGRYIGHLPVLILGMVSVIVGNWFRTTRREIGLPVVMMVVMVFIIAFVGAMQIQNDTDLFVPAEVLHRIMNLTTELQEMISLAKGAMLGS